LYQIEILGTTGALLQKINSSGASYTINISHLPQGLYFVRAINLTNNQLITETIIKE